jgi:hypothetical protein
MATNTNSSMIQQFIIFYLVAYWAIKVITKDNWIQGKLESIGNWFKQKSMLSNFFLGAAECPFCLENHTATIGAVIYYSYCLDYRVLIWGVFFASINAWLREFME